MRRLYIFLFFVKHLVCRSQCCSHYSLLCKKGSSSCFLPFFVPLHFILRADTWGDDIFLSWLVGYISAFFKKKFFFVRNGHCLLLRHQRPCFFWYEKAGLFLGGFHNDVPHFSQTLVCIFYAFFFVQSCPSWEISFLFSIVSNERREQRRFYAFLFVLVQFEARPSLHTCSPTILSSPC